MTASSSSNLLDQFTDVRRIRNVCVIAHVDHGKTTLTDSLLASNGIISERSAGALRFLDSRGDERERFITMQSSAISLRWQGKGDEGETLINLIDSPGHVDFGSEVNTAARLADGALVVVDVVEGVSSQTRAVLRQAWKDDLRTILVLNKMDRLQSELYLSPDEAFEHLNRILEAVNVATQQLVGETEFDDLGEGTEVGDQGEGGHEVVFDEEKAAKWTYHPRHGNVVFACAVHGWGFSVPTFVDIIAAKLQCNKETLRKTLWGDYAYQPKTKKIVKRPHGSTMRALFPQFCLDIIWKIYKSTGDELDREFLTKMQSQLKFTEDVGTLSPNCTKQVLSPWLPLSGEILNRILEAIPGPVEAAESRLPHFVPFADERANGSELKSSLMLSDRKGPLCAYVTKFLLADVELGLLASDSRREDEELPTDFIGLTRVFSGTLRPKTRVIYTETGETLTIGAVFLVMGIELFRVNEAHAGSLCGIVFQERSTAQYMTLVDASSTWKPTFRSPYPNKDTTSIVTVALRTTVEHLESFMGCLQMLRRTDPAVDVRVLDSGEYTIGCCGNEHLKRCIHDLESIYCPEIPFTVSEPLVSCRETLNNNTRTAEDGNDCLILPWDKKYAKPPGVVGTEKIEKKEEGGGVGGGGADNADNEDDDDAYQRREEEKLKEKEKEQKRKKAPGVTYEANGAITLVRQMVTLRIRAYALKCDTWIDELDEDSGNWDLDAIAKGSITSETPTEGGENNNEKLVGISNARGSRTVLFNQDPAFPWKLVHSYRRRRLGIGDDGYEDGDGADRVGGAHDGPNPGGGVDDGIQSSCGAMSTVSSFYNRGHLCSALISGFSLASQAGPLCEEPIRNVAFVLEQISLEGSEEGKEERHGISGQVMYAMKEALRQAMLRYKNMVRIQEPILMLDIQAEQEVLGKVYGVLHKRRTKILSEDLRDGTSTFIIAAHIPLQESFGLVDELRKKTSGLAHFSAWFSHWQTLDEDPFYELNLKLEDHEDHGEAGALERYPHNVSRKLLVQIRKRKGLVVEEKIISSDSTKQRTMTRMK